MPQSLEEKVEEFTINNRLLDGVKRVGLAVSGGSDSLFLLRTFSKICLKYNVEPFVLTFNHKIVGETGDEDVAFVEEECKRNGLECIVGTGDNICAKDGKSMEMVAREARRSFFLEMARCHSLDAIATGHQMDDVAETLLMRLLRGAGATGLSGMRPIASIKGYVKLIRPLLTLRRNEIIAFFLSQKTDFRTDPSNTSEAIRRNEIRLSLLPALVDRYGQDPVPHIAQSAGILAEEDQFLDGLIPNDGAVFGIHKVLAKRAIRKWLFAHNFSATFDETERIIALNDGERTMLSSGKIVVRRGNFLREVVAPNLDEMVLKSGVFGNFTIDIAYVTGVIREQMKIGAWPLSCTISRSFFEANNLIIRTRRDGDFMLPSGMNGRKKLQDIFTDIKLPREDRDTYPLIAIGSEVIWVPGYRVSQKCLVGDGEDAIKITIQRRENGGL